MAFDQREWGVQHHGNVFGATVYCNSATDTQATITAATGAYFTDNLIAQGADGYEAQQRMLNAIKAAVEAKSPNNAQEHGIFLEVIGNDKAAGGRVSKQLYLENGALKVR